MADNFIKQGIQSIVSWAFADKAPKDRLEKESIARQSSLAELVNYYDGVQKKPLRVTGMGKNYNVLTNHIKTVVDRSVSMLFGAGVEFDLPGTGGSQQDQVISNIWAANKKDILLHDLGQFGAIYGTPAIKIIPDGITSLRGETSTRLVALNPFNLSIFTAANDIDDVREFVFRWMDGDASLREITRKEEGGFWVVETQKADKSTNYKWATVEKETWEHEFPPIVAGKNLPNAGGVYGLSDIAAVIDLQDRYNETQSNINKILSLQAWAQKYIIGGRFPRRSDGRGNEWLDMAPDKALEIQNSDAKLGILQPSGDLDSSRQFAQDIRRDLFEIASTVDADTVKDKVGALTNFGLRVLFKNELAKNATKQLLYGDLLLTVNNYLLRLAGFDGENADPGLVVFGDPMPTDNAELIQVLTQEHDLGVTSLETAAKTIGRNWAEEQERLSDEQTQADALGGNLLRDFLAGNQG